MNHARRSVILLLLIASVGIVPAGSAQLATGTLAGTVLDADGQPVDYATVTMQTSDGDHPNLMRTDGDGHFEFVRFRTGEYDVRAQARGIFSDWTKHVRIHSHKTTRITLRLPASKP
jgi:Carboxypeptidase regulatory-like domain